MTIAQQIYENSVWGEKKVACPIEHVHPTQFKKGTVIVRCNYIEEKKRLYFEDVENEKVVATYYLQQDGTVGNCS